MAEDLVYGMRFGDILGLSACVRESVAELCLAGAIESPDLFIEIWILKHSRH